MVLGLLIGNSSIRFGILHGTGVVRSGAIEWDALEARGHEIAEAAECHGAATAVAGSVRDDLLPAAGAHVPRGLLPIQLAGRDFPVPMASLYERPEELGVDRLLCAVAASRRAAGAGAVVVDFGSAISMSVVSPEGAFLGGLIAAGGRAMLRGIEAVTPRLSRVEIRASRDFVARSARAALQAGLFWQVCGGARAMLEGILGSLPFRPRVFATGGQADLFSSEVPRIEEVVPTLGLEGLAISWDVHSARGPDPCARPGIGPP